MRPNLLLQLVASISILCPAGFSTAQNNSPEYIESSSPLPSGGRVTSRIVPGAGIQTVVSGVPLSTTGNGLNSVLEPNGVRNPAAPIYPPPASTPPATGLLNPYRSPMWTNPTGSRLNRSVVLYQPVRAHADRGNPIPYQIPTLGITNTVPAQPSQSSRQYSVPVVPPCNCNPQSYLRVPTAESNPGPPGAILPPNDLTLSPTQPNTGAYQPVVRVANDPPGTYPGRGIFGRSISYVDGQPVRNLFRYVFP